MSRSKKESPTISKQSYPVKVVERSIREALKSHQKSVAKRFLDVLVMPPRGHDGVYLAAAENVLGEIAEAADRRKHSFEAILGDDDTVHVLNHLGDFEHGVLLVRSTTEISEEARLRADRIALVREASVEDFISVASELLGQALSLTQAVFLQDQSWKNLALAFSKDRSVGQAIKKLRDVARLGGGAVVRSVAKSDRRLEDMPGYGEAKDWGLRLAADLTGYQRGEISWEDVDRGVVLCGPPGVGKTAFAQALANSCGVRLIHGSAAKWQAAGHMGDMLKAMRRTFTEARAAAPCILLIDELDGFGDRDKADTHNLDYIREVIGGLLELLDGLEGREGVVVIGATNRPGDVDPAILRSGRLERVIEVPLPDVEARYAILRLNIPTLETCRSAQFEEITESWTGADIERLAREVRRFVRPQKRTSTMADVEHVLPERSEFSPEVLRRIAIHEAGHVVVASEIGVEEIVEVRVLRYRPTNAHGLTVSGGHTVLKPPAGLTTKSGYEGMIARTLAGMEAEAALLGEMSDGAGGGPGSDLSRATDFATAMVAAMGMDEHLVTEVFDHPSERRMLRAANPMIWHRIDNLLQTQRARARSIVDKRKPQVLALAEALIEKGKLNGSEVRALLHEVAEGMPRSLSAEWEP